MLHVGSSGAKNTQTQVLQPPDKQTLPLMKSIIINYAYIITFMAYDSIGATHLEINYEQHMICRPFKHIVSLRMLKCGSCDA